MGMAGMKGKSLGTLEAGQLQDVVSGAQKQQGFDPEGHVLG